MLTCKTTTCKTAIFSVTGQCGHSEMIRFTVSADATDFSDFHSTVLAGYVFPGNKVIHLEGVAMVDLIVRTVGEEIKYAFP